MPFLKHIFSVEDNIDKTRRTVTFLGIKINVKIKPKRKKISKNAKTNNFGITISNDEVVILANGPSLNDSLGDKDTRFFIESKDKICLNYFPLSEQFLKLKPNYFFCMDPVYWNNNLAGNLKELTLKTVSKLEEVNWDINVVLPQFAKKWNWFMQVAQNNKHVKIAYINTQESDWKDENRKFLEYKTNFSMPGPQNVLVASLYCAINIGYKKIHIFGADHDWHKDLIVDDNNVVCIQKNHFYDGQNQVESRPMYKNPEETCVFTMSEIMSVLATTYGKYELLERYSKFMGSKIYNMSKISYIDAFERKKLGEEEYVKQ